MKILWNFVVLVVEFLLIFHYTNFNGGIDQSLCVNYKQNALATTSCNS